MNLTRNTSALKAEPKAVSLQGLSSFRVTGQKSSYPPRLWPSGASSRTVPVPDLVFFRVTRQKSSYPSCLRPSRASSGSAPVPDLVFLPDYRAEVGILRQLPLILDRKSRFIFLNFDFLWKKVGIRRNITPDSSIL